jgi:hypothetical protein
MNNLRKKPEEAKPRKGENIVDNSIRKNDDGRGRPVRKM